MLIRLCGGHLFLFLLFAPQHLFPLANDFSSLPLRVFPTHYVEFWWGNQRMCSTYNQQKREDSCKLLQPNTSHQLPTLPTVKLWRGVPGSAMI